VRGKGEGEEKRQGGAADTTVMLRDKQDFGWEEA
jgi:hypothetical protein